MRSHFQALLTFGVVGVLTAMIFFGVMGILESLLHMNYLIAMSAGYGLAVVFNFFMHQRMTFQAHYNQTKAQFNRYMRMVVLNYLITFLVVHLCVARWLLSPYVGACLAIAVTTVTGYILGRYWVFKRQG